MNRTLTLKFTHDELGRPNDWNSDALEASTGSARSESDHQLFLAILKMDVMNEAIYELHLDLCADTFEANLAEEIRHLPFMHTLQALRLESQLESSHVTEQSESFVWAQFPGLCPQLRRLQLDLELDEKGFGHTYELEACLVGSHWPDLEEISIINFGGNQDVVCEFLKPHRETLREVGFYGSTAMEEDQQIDLLGRLRNMGLNLDICTFTEDSWPDRDEGWDRMPHFQSLFAPFMQVRTDLAIETRGVGSYVDGRPEKDRREIVLRDSRRERDGTIKPSLSGNTNVCTSM